MLRTWIDGAEDAAELNPFDLLRMVQAGETPRFLLWAEHAAYETDESLSFLQLAKTSMPKGAFRECVVACHAPSHEWLAAVSEIGIDRLYHGSPHFGHFPRAEDCLYVTRLHDELCRYFTPPEETAIDLPTCATLRHSGMLLNGWHMQNRCFGNHEECPRYQEVLEREGRIKQVNHDA